MRADAFKGAETAEEPRKREGVNYCRVWLWGRRDRFNGGGPSADGAGRFRVERVGGLSLSSPSVLSQAPPSPSWWVLTISVTTSGLFSCRAREVIASCSRTLRRPVGFPMEVLELMDVN